MSNRQTSFIRGFLVSRNMKDKEKKPDPITKPEIKCPFVSERGPSCPQCGADPIDVNIDEPSRTAMCDKCGHRFRIPKKLKRK